MRRRSWSVRSRGRCSACGSAGGLAVAGDEKCERIHKTPQPRIKTYLNGTPTSNSVIDTTAASSSGSWVARWRGRSCRAQGCFFFCCPPPANEVSYLWDRGDGRGLPYVVALD